MGKIFSDMTAEEQAYYDEDSKKFPWLKTITMSDDEFFACFERDLGKGAAALWFNHLWNKHYSWVFLAILKHFYETGEFVHFDWDYTDSQSEGVLWDIMIAWGADLQTGGDVLSCRAKFDFSKYTAPTNSTTKRGGSIITSKTITSLTDSNTHLKRDILHSFLSLL